MPARFSPVAWILAAILIWQGSSQLLHCDVITRDDWGLTDWLVNYSGGFVRRGLAGTILHWISETWGISPLVVILPVSGLCYAGLAAWFLKSTAQEFPPALILSPVVLGFPAYQSTIARKDCLLLLILIACLHCLRNFGSLKHKWCVINLLCCVGILLHETFAFFALPGLIILHTSATWKSIGVRFAALLPSITCLVLVTTYHGDHQTAQAIHDSWTPLWFAIDPSLQASPFATIQSIGWTREEGMAQTLGILNKGLYQPLAWAVVASITFLLAARIRCPKRFHSESGEWPALLGFQLVAISPLFLVGVDYGRWMFFWIASSMIFWHYACRIPEPFAANPLYRRFATPAGQVIATFPNREWLLLLFGLPVLWSIRNFLTATPIGRLISGLGW